MCNCDCDGEKIEAVHRQHERTEDRLIAELNVAKHIIEELRLELAATNRYAGTE